MRIVILQVQYLVCLRCFFIHNGIILLSILTLYHRQFNVFQDVYTILSNVYTYNDGMVVYYWNMELFCVRPCIV